MTSCEQVRDMGQVTYIHDMNALVSSRLNSLLSGIAETDFTKLQRILNHLARMVTKSPPFVEKTHTQ